MFWVEMTENTMHHTAFRVRQNTDPRWVEFRGDAMCRWIFPEHWGDLTPTSAQLLHDCMEGWHTCVMHAGEPVAIMKTHPDYEHVARMFEVR